MSSMMIFVCVCGERGRGEDDRDESGKRECMCVDTCLC